MRMTLIFVEPEMAFLLAAERHSQIKSGVLKSHPDPELAD